jgi:hypothetical protein
MSTPMENEAIQPDLVERVTAAIVALAHHGIPSDVQELLLHGNPTRGIRPKALHAAIAATRPDLNTVKLREAKWAECPNGDAADALDYALVHINDSHERTDFLECWYEGDVGYWPDYLRWLSVQRDGARAASTAEGEG